MKHLVIHLCLLKPCSVKYNNIKTQNLCHQWSESNMYHGRVISLLGGSMICTLWNKRKPEINGYLHCLKPLMFPKNLGLKETFKTISLWINTHKSRVWNITWFQNISLISYQILVYLTKTDIKWYQNSLCFNLSFYPKFLKEKGKLQLIVHPSWSGIPYPHDNSLAFNH